MPDGTQGGAATLIQGAGIVVADRASHRVQPLVEGVGIGGEQSGLDVGGPRAVVGFADIDMAPAPRYSVRRTAAGSSGRPSSRSQPGFVDR